jgi:transposase-like protein
MGQKRKRHAAEFKSKVALEALKGTKTVNELSSQYGVHATQISQWKGQLQQGSREIFTGTRAKDSQDHEAEQAKLYEEIGRLKMELDWLKKTAGFG